MISFQAAEPLDVDIHDILEGTYHRSAWEKLLTHLKDEEGMNDQCTEEDNFSVYAYTHPESYSASYMVTNESDEHLKVTLDVTGSNGVLFVPSDGIIEKTIKPGESSYFGSTACDPDAYSFVFSYQAEAEEVEVEENEENEENSEEESDQ